MKKIFILFIALVLSANYAQSNNSLHPIDTARWQKAVKGLDYTEATKQKKQKEPANLKPASPLNINSNSIKILLYITVIILLVYILLRIFGKNIFSKNKKIKSAESISISNLDEFPMESDLERFLREALEKKDYRLAIRIYYLNTLKLLNEKKFIVWQRSKTNHDYLQEVYNKNFYLQFNMHTSVFEYMLYGEKQVNETQYQMLQSSFSNLLTRIKSESK